MNYILTQEELDKLKAPHKVKTHEGDLYKAIMSADIVKFDKTQTLGMPDEKVSLTIYTSQLPREIIERLKLRPDVRK